MIGAIVNAIKKIWNFLKKIFLKVLNFFDNIVSWFKNLNKVFEEDEIPVVLNLDKLSQEIQSLLDDPKNYNPVEAGLKKFLPLVFNKKLEKIVNYENVILAEQLDQKTEQSFGDKPMIVVN